MSSRTKFSLRHPLLPLLGVLLGLWLNFQTAAMYRETQSDFFQDYTAARALLEGASWYRGFPHPHPPFAVLASTPFALLPLGGAFLAFAAFSIFCVELLCQQLSRTLKREDLWILLFALTILWPEFRGVIGLGSLSAVVALLTTLSLLSLANGKDERAGMFLAIATAIKIYPGFLLVALLGLRRTKALIGFAATFLALHLPILLVFGPAPFLEWMDIGIPFALQFVDVPINCSLPGYLSRLFGSPGGYREPIISLPAWTSALSTVISSTGLLGAYLLSRRARSLPLRDQAFVAYGLSLCLILPTQTICWSHYFIILVPILSWLALVGRSKAQLLIPCILLFGWEVMLRHSSGGIIDWLHALPVWTEGVLPILGLATLGMAISKTLGKSLTRSQQHVSQ